ncbi:hypothetical protein OIU77_002086 [Salix suchowensis]|uniref:O-acyltransferase WSD1 C-terminal domain-containing protein n=1 Tax=Salix suchowensis TaxID=1278906 RepID=A0ABQ9B5U3_9ROSI|nr:hypothetical protein OIU77_002086 [Salix suchowensis]
MEIVSEPVSPSGQFLSNSVLSVSIIAVMEFEQPFDDPLSIIPFLKDVFLPDLPRFSSIMVADKDGVKRWKRVEVRLSDHVNFPVFTAAMSAQFYDGCFDEYLSKMATAQFPQGQPLWEVHVLNYPTSHAASNIIFKLHHSLGAVWIREAETPIRSGHSGVESLPVAITTITFSLDHIKQIKAKLGVTLNDVITGTIFLGTRMYMETVSQGSGSACSTSLVLFNTRMLKGYNSVQEMLKPDSKAPWGNHVAYLKIPIPKLGDAEATNNPLKFVINARKIIKRKRSSIGVYLTAKYLLLVARFRGPNGASRCIRGTLENTSMAISNVMGPVEQVAFASNPVNGLYFVVTGAPQSLGAGVTSYIGKLRVALLAEKDFIDPPKLKSQIEKAFEMISEAACREST